MGEKNKLNMLLSFKINNATAGESSRTEAFVMLLTIFDKYNVTGYNQGWWCGLYVIGHLKTSL